MRAWGCTPFDWVIVVIALAVRLLVVFSWVEPEETLFADMGEYHRNALAIAQGHSERVRTVLPLGFSIATGPLLVRPYGWTVFKILQCVVGAASVALGGLAVRAAFGATAGRIAIVALALHVPWITYCGVFIPETIHALLMTLFLWLCARTDGMEKLRTHAGVGLALFGAMFVKGLSALLVPLWGAYLFWNRALPRAGRWARTAVFAGGVGAATLLASALTMVAVGKPVLLASASGLNFVEGKCPEKRHIDSTGMHAQSPLFLQQGRSTERRWPRPFTDAPFFFAAGLECIRKDPSVVPSSLTYVAYLFMGNESWPANQTPLRDLNRRYERAFAAWVLMFGTAGVFACRRRLLQPQIAPFTLSITALFLTVWIFKSEMRYRTPFDAAFVAFASFGSIAVARWTRFLVRARTGGSADESVNPRSG